MRPVRCRIRLCRGNFRRVAVPPVRRGVGEHVDHHVSGALGKSVRLRRPLHLRAQVEHGVHAERSDAATPTSLRRLSSTERYRAPRRTWLPSETGHPPMSRRFGRPSITMSSPAARFTLRLAICRDRSWGSRDRGFPHDGQWAKCVFAGRSVFLPRSSPVTLSRASASLAARSRLKPSRSTIRRTATSSASAGIV